MDPTRASRRSGGMPWAGVGQQALESEFGGAGKGRVVVCQRLCWWQWVSVSQVEAVVPACAVQGFGSWLSWGDQVAALE
ncbi:hypothetical protein Slala03_76560 [Streptomyces lavendulae subsp. lavendulae]|nr:hypothetical protein Slala03_76560 [Streptomyces lavendulae subsp. lavendulae]